MTDQHNDIPKGYWKDAAGSLVPVSKIKDIDKLRQQKVTELCEAAITASNALAAFKLEAMLKVQQFVDVSHAEYGVKKGGDKGNVTLVSFDGDYKIVRSIQDTIVFDERLQAAKALIDECVTRWSKGSNDKIKALVQHAFQVDKKGSVSTGRVLGLRALAIDDDTWLQAMQAINDSLRVAKSKPYIRFYKRDADTGEYMPIPLDVAVV